MNESLKDTKKTIQSIDRAFEIIRCFDSVQELGVTEISKLINLPKSTAFGLISTLHSNNILEKNDITGKYKLGLGLYHLGMKVNFSLREIVFPYLEELVNIYKETANLVVLQEKKVVYLDKVESSFSIGINTLVGGQKPLYCTAVGKSILAFLKAKELKEILENMELVKYTNNTIINKDTLIEELKRIRIQGYGEDIEEMELGLHCIGTPILNQYGSPFAAISISGPVSRMNKEICKEMGATLVEFANQISKKIGYLR